MSNADCERTFFDELPVPLTDEERLELAEVMVDGLQAVERCQDHLRAMKERYKEELEKLAAPANEARRRLAKGTKPAEVECLARFDFLAGRVTTLRKDTGEELENREMTTEERQRRLELMDGNEAAAS